MHLWGAVGERIRGLKKRIVVGGGYSNSDQGGTEEGIDYSHPSYTYTIITVTNHLLALVWETEMVHTSIRSF